MENEKREVSNPVRSSSHAINITDRKNANISGVKRVVSFDEQEFVVETIMGYILIKGENLEIIKLETFQGDLHMKGMITSLDYLEANKEKKHDPSFISKLFK